MYGLYRIVLFTIFDILKGLASPFFIFIFFIIYFQYYKKTEVPLKATIISILYGIVGGMIVTVALIYLKIYIIPLEYIYILITSLLLSIIDSRFICFSYGGSLLSLMSLVFHYPKINITELMIVISLLHAVEGVLILINGSSQKMFNIFNIKGQIKDGYEFNRFWPIPFVVFIGDTMIKPFLLFAILSYGDFTIGRFPRKKTLETSLMLLLYSSILFTITMISPYKFIAPIFSLLAHELIIFINIYRERSNLNSLKSIIKGVNVTGINSKGIGKELGLKTGDIIVRINHYHVKNSKDFIELSQKSFNKVKIEYFNHKKGLVKKKYRGKKNSLGIKIS
ncbi:MAG: hypothetical protein ACTHW2_06365 [Tissierella sp.]|uniref:hypothetical protein n=1 Tax=Tissierella sp. TaxID=41274 RepID=UPI003F9A95F3